jgi:KDO2-lipid IV(A) lauroyltransferase
MFKRLRRLFAYRLAYYGARLLMAVAGALPRRAGRRLFGWLGALAYLTLAKSRRVALVNLRFIYGSAFPDKEIRRIALGAFVNLGRCSYDVARLGRMTPDGIRKIVAVTGVDHLDAALARGKGVVGVTGHVGNWELLAAYLALAGYPVNVIASRLKDVRLDTLVADLRRKAGLVVIERSRGLKEALLALRRGEFLGLLIDQDTAVDSVVVDFLGKPAKTAVGMVKLAAHTGAAIVPMAALGNEDGTYRIEIKEPIAVSGNGARLADDVGKCSKAVEAFINAEPAQWVWMHKRWKSVVSDMYS